MIKKTRINFFSVLLFFSTLLNTAVGQEFVAPFFRMQQSLLQEKLYIHTDKPYYTVGDTIYYRGTLVNASSHSLVVKTNYIYVELYGENDKKPLFRKKLKRDNLCFHNRFILPDTLRAGKYTLQAYTNWMRNFGDENFFSRSLYVVNMGNTVGVASSDKKEKRDYAVTFFPEGGALLAGQSQRIAFKVQGSDGYSESVDGEIQDAQGKVLARFSTIHDGMGSFSLDIPAEGSLKAIVTALKDSLRKEIVLPSAVQQGIALSVIPQEKKLAYKVLGYKPATSCSLIVHSRGKLLEVRTLTGEKMEGEISTDTYPDGVLQLLLCDGTSGKALSRRLVFIRNGGQEKWVATHDKPLDMKREKVIVDLALSDYDGRPLRGDFSVSVIDAGQVTAHSLADNVVSNLLMTSDLRGYIENPAWYFENMDKHKREALDLVMLTHGWSRFATDYITATPELPALNYKLEVGQYISGRVDGLSEKDQGAQISITDGENSFVSGKVDKKGRFYFDGIEYPDSLLMKARIATKDKRTIRIRFDQYSSPGVYRKEPDGFLKDKRVDETKNGKMTTAGGINIVDLPEVVISKNARVNSIAGNVWVDNAWDFDSERLREEFGGNLNRTANSAVQQISKERSWLDGVSTVVINDMPYNDRGILNDINAIDIERLTFIRKDYNTLATDLTKAGGLVVITLKPGASIYKRIVDHRKVAFSLLGYAWPEYFYHPVYDTSKKQKDDSISDWRTTIYWNPSIQTDETGHRKIAFFTSDRPGNYHIIIEGVTLNGRPVWYSRPL